MKPEPMGQGKSESEILTENDFGDLADNSFALLMIEKLIAACRPKDALEQLRKLQDHIKRSKDLKSQVYLLGRIEVKILSLAT